VVPGLNPWAFLPQIGKCLGDSLGMGRSSHRFPFRQAVCLGGP
jgi:hypothetical protein